MSSGSRLHPGRLRASIITVLTVALVLFVYRTSWSSCDSAINSIPDDPKLRPAVPVDLVVGESPSQTSNGSSAKQKPRESKYAFATFLNAAENEDDENAEDTVYFTAVRLLAFQLLHDPETRSETIPFVVIVDPGVNQTKRTRLEAEGATIVEYPSVENSWMKPARERWAHTLDKLNVLRLTQFEKVLIMDSDIVIFKPLDGIFEEPETALQTNMGREDMAPADEGPQPKTYLMAADSRPVDGTKHKWPAKRNGVLNAGFLVIHPSQEMFDHALRVASIENRTRGDSPENALWEYIHRKDGNLPFSHLKDHWVMNSPNNGDLTHDVHAVHEKFWRGSNTDHKLKEQLLRYRWRMDGYWFGRQQQQSL